MSIEVETIITEVLSWPSNSRAFLASKLLESLDHEEDFPVPDEWKAEIAGRCKEIDEGRVRLIAAEQVFDQIQQRKGGQAW